MLLGISGVDTCEKASQNRLHETVFPEPPYSSMDIVLALTLVAINANAAQTQSFEVNRIFFINFTPYSSRIG